MCGIFGYIGSDEPAQVCIEGLKLLEYRGYDSAGIAGILDGKIQACKQVGKVALLEQLLATTTAPTGTSIAHTRWATHGEPSTINAHPHFDPDESLALVHNGIIENFQQLRAELSADYLTETDSEVIAHLIANHYKEDLLDALVAATQRLKGSYALAVVHKSHPDELIACAYDSPLAVGISSDACYIASDAHAFKGKKVKVAFLTDGEIARCTRTKVTFFDRLGKPIEKEMLDLDLENEAISKHGFDHFMMKEIHEQPQALQATLEEFRGIPLGDVKQILILGCGTSWHAGLLGQGLMEHFAKIPTRIEIASEFRYSNPLIDDKTLVLAISQSGETADTLAAVRLAKSYGARIIGLCNVPYSTLTRITDHTVFLHAGQEVSVCSTKAFTCQVLTLVLMAMYFGEKDIDIAELPIKVQKVLACSNAIKAAAAKYSSFENFFFLGRRYMYPTALEAALKLKEISYLNAIAYPAGEMKHGPIALVGPALAVIALCGNDQTREKLLSNLMEVKARSSPILAIVNEGDHTFDAVATDVVYLPAMDDVLATIPYSVAMQLFAYYVACKKGTDIDQPRNLAKSVTVE